MKSAVIVHAVKASKEGDSDESWDNQGKMSEQHMEGDN